MTEFQVKFLQALDVGVWYDVYKNQHTGGAALPEWFYQQQSEPMHTITPLVKSKALARRDIGIHGLPQVRRLR